LAGVKRRRWSIERAPLLGHEGQLLDATTQRLLAGERVEVQSVCAELGLSRATVHRWFGSRDRVLGEVMVGLVGPLFRAIERENRVRLRG
jgi:AcrR family transcriptional regulator